MNRTTLVRRYSGNCRSLIPVEMKMERSHYLVYDIDMEQTRGHQLKGFFIKIATVLDD